MPLLTKEMQIKIKWDFIRQRVQFCSVPQSCPTLFNPGTAAHQASLSITNSRSLLKLMSIESVMPSNHLLLCCPLLLLPSIFPSIRVQGTLKSLLTTQPWANHFIRSGSLVFLSAKWNNSSLPCLPEGWLGLHRGIPTKSALKGTTLHKGAQREPAS